MGTRFVILVVIALLIVPWASFPTSSASDARSSEDVSVNLTKEVWGSNEAFFANILAENLVLGQGYLIDWAIRTGNGSQGSDFTVRNGQINFTATTTSSQQNVLAYHLNSSSSYLHRLIINLSSSGSILSSTQVNFSAFTNALPTSYSNILVFGDSLSDMGNSYNQWGTPDSPPYWNGRYTNGEVWSVYFGQFMEHTMTPGRGNANGNNRAYSGAHSGSGSYLLVIPNVGKQVDDFLQNNVIAQSELVIIWCGSNDFVHSDEQDAQKVVDNIESHITKLSNSGASNFLVMELPPLDTVPRVNEDKDEAGVEAFRERVLEFNSKLHTMLNHTVNSSSLTIHRGMSWSLYDIVYNNPSYFGITNITHPACDHDGFSCENNDPVAPNAEEYIFFDKMHPTLTMHNLIYLYTRQLMGVEDLDGDDVADDVDECLYTLPGVPVMENGCDVPPPDIDGDGVNNEDDYCPDTPANESVNSDGCSPSQLDGDSDGVMNDIDECPETPANESVNEVGCGWSQFDDDDDGVPNGPDLCPDTNPNASVDLNGCSESQKDDDLDGVMNDADSCPDTWAGSQIDENGCALYQKDSDSDGINDHKDDCANTPVGDTVDSAGCGSTQKDDDSDNVMNAYDECPFTPSGETVNAVGCALVELDTDYDGISDAVDVCTGTEYGAETNTDGCSIEQLDSDDDGFNNRDDLCPNTAGESGGCPTLSTTVITPDFGSLHYYGDNISFTIEISCSSGCLMEFNQESSVGEFNSPHFDNLSNGTVVWSMLVPNQTPYQKIDFDLNLTSEGVSDLTSHTILISEPKQIDVIPNLDQLPESEIDETSSESGLVGSSDITIILLLCIFAIVIILYRQKKTEPIQKMTEEEKWMEQTELVSRENNLQRGAIEDEFRYS